MATATAEAQQSRLSDVWWLVLLEGIAALILGLLLITNTGITLFTLIIFLGIYWLIDGIFSLIRIFVGNSDIHWGWLLARGILGILAGLLVLRHPLYATILVPAVIVIILGIQGIIIGAIRLVQAFKGDGLWAGVLGVLSIIFGLILLFNPVLGALALPVVVGIFGIIGGIILIIQSFRIKSAAA
jgi:uncharacterized membrane protein HdeD (DUF308 family)